MMDEAWLTVYECEKCSQTVSSPVSAERLEEVWFSRFVPEMLAFSWLRGRNGKSFKPNPTVVFNNREETTDREEPEVIEGEGINYNKMLILLFWGLY